MTNTTNDILYFVAISVLLIQAYAVLDLVESNTIGYSLLFVLMVIEVVILVIYRQKSLKHPTKTPPGSKSAWMRNICGAFSLIVMIIFWYILLVYTGLSSNWLLLAASITTLILTFAIVSRGNFVALGEIKRLFLGNFLSLSISFLVLLGFLAVIALFWYAPTHFTLEPKAIEESFYINNSSMSTVETIAIRNLGADLREVNISVEGAAINGIIEEIPGAENESSNNIYIILDQQGNFSLLSRERKFISAVIDTSRAKMAGEYRGTINVIAAGNDMEHHRKSIPIIIKIKLNESVKLKDKNNTVGQV